MKEEGKEKEFFVLLVLNVGLNPLYKLLAKIEYPVTQVEGGNK